MQQLCDLALWALGVALPRPPPELSLPDLVYLKQQQLTWGVQPPALKGDTPVASKGGVPNAEAASAMQKAPAEWQAAQQVAPRAATNPIAEVGAQHLQAIRRGCHRCTAAAGHTGLQTWQLHGFSGLCGSNLPPNYCTPCPQPCTTLWGMHAELDSTSIVSARPLRLHVCMSA